MEIGKYKPSGKYTIQFQKIKIEIYSGINEKKCSEFVVNFRTKETKQKSFDLFVFLHVKLFYLNT